MIESEKFNLIRNYQKQEKHSSLNWKIILTLTLTLHPDFVSIWVFDERIAFELTDVIPL